MDQHIQLSANTFIDNSVVNFTAHQIEFLRKVASYASFNGITEPDLTASRKSGPFVLTYFHGTQRRSLLVGKYRTLPWPQAPQLYALRTQSIPGINRDVVKALSVFSLPADDNAPADVLGRLQWAHSHVIRHLVSPNPEGRPYETTQALYKLAVAAITIGNLKFSEEFHMRGEL